MIKLNVGDVVRIVKEHPGGMYCAKERAQLGIVQIKVAVVVQRGTDHTGETSGVIIDYHSVYGRILFSYPYVWDESRFELVERASK